MWRSRTFWRLFGTYGLLWLVLIGVLGIGIVGNVEHYYLEHVEQSLRAKAVLAREMVRGRPAADSPALQQRIEIAGRDAATRLTFMAADGTVLADSEKDPRRQTIENHLGRPEVQEALRLGSGISRRRHSTTVDRDMMYLAVRTDDPDGAVAFVRVALPLDGLQAQVADLRRMIWSATAVAGIAGLALAFWLARRGTRPLQELTTGAEVIARGCYGYRVYAMAQDEVGVLARAFNTMSERLAEQFAQLEGERQQLRAILSGLVEGVIALDADQSILFANERAAELLEFKPKAAVGRKLWEVVRQRTLDEIVRKAVAASEPCSQELKWDGQGGKTLTVHAARLTGSPLGGAVLVLHDTTELRRLERLRRDFVANVSHELKTPLSVIKACVETLLDGAAEVAQDREQFLRQVGDQADRLHALILDLLSLARIESGTEVFSFQAVRLAPAVADCLARHRARAEAKGQQIELYPPSAETNGERGEESRERGARSAEGGPLLSTSAPPLPCPAALAAWADEEAVAEILDNLVDNAVKYTPKGGRIGVLWWEEGDQVCIEVEDTGIGIPESDLPRIFERFYRADKARSRELGGTGLGLSIVKHLAQAMHGSVSATSRPGQGSKFTVRLPLAGNA